ncbi:MAG: glucose-1-phosphate adenylyltransferase [Chloroflexi bacterium]|nr:glucose-1-phosphate adenylyltransferase [Chloroflexota bacterium]
MASLNQILAVILGGGRGSRLYPLTKMRAKPAVPIAGKYRLIDIPISNCINSGIYRIAVLTQFNSVSLHRHITGTYHFDSFHSGFVQIWAAEQTNEISDWYQGTADAVRKQTYQIRSTQAQYVLILAGDHLYHMDYDEMARFHWEKNADITIAVQPVRKDEAGRFGLLKLDDDNRIKSFAEKPKDAPVLVDLVSRDDPARPYLGSMGIYLFNTDVLIDLLSSSDFEDFGKHVIPHSIGTRRVFGFNFDDYWEDIGTIRSFYETNLELTLPESQFNLYKPDHPIYTHARFLPGSIVENSRLKNVLLAEGCLIYNAEITHSVIGLRSVIGNNVQIKDSILMGADYYNREIPDDNEIVPIGIGQNSHIEGAIIDKNARIGENVMIHPFPPGTDLDALHWTIRDGIVVIPKNTTIYSGTRIGPESQMQ